MSWRDFIDIAGIFLQGVGWACLPVFLLPLIAMILKSKWLIEVSTLIVQMVEIVSYHTGELIKWALPLLVLSVAFSVFALSIFGLSWTKLFESAEYLHAAVIMLGASATLLAGQHVRVDIFHSAMSPNARAWVDFCGYYILLMPVCLIILWDSQSFVTFSWRIFEGSAEADGIRGEFLLKTLLPVFCVLMLAQGLAIALRAAIQITGYEAPARPPHTPPFFREQELEH